MALPQIIADFESALSTAIAIGGTSFSLSSVLDDDSVAIPNGTYYFTVDNSSSSKEYLTGTLTGSAVTGVKSVSRQGVETSGAVRPHRVGAPCIITDFATYKRYIDGIAISGTIPATKLAAGIARLSATPANASDPVVISDTDPRVFPNAYGVSTAGTDDYVVNLTTAPTAYVAGQEYAFKADVANTGPATINFNSLGAKSIVQADGVTALSDSLIGAGEIVILMYDGTNMRVLKAGAIPTDYQVFTVSGTWAKPSGLTGNELVKIMVWGAGGGGGSGSSATVAGGGGGGGACVEATFPSSALGSTETITVATTASPGVAGGSSSFGTKVTAYGGGTAPTNVANSSGGGGGGALGVGGNGGNSTSSGGVGGAPGNVLAGISTDGYGGGGGASSGNPTPGSSAYGGGGGCGNNGGNPATGGNSLYGGGGGAPGMQPASGNSPIGGGTSVFAGAGGAQSKGVGFDGVAPAGGGGGGGGTNSGGSGARGEIRVWVIRS